MTGSVRDASPPRPAATLTNDERASWENWYASTDYTRLPWYSPRPSPWLVNAVRKRWIEPGSAVLDVGCGTGSNVLWLGRNGFRASGVDIAPSAVASAIARAKRAGVNVSFQVADAVALPFPRGAFDAALDSGCFHSLPRRSREEYANEMARVLRPKGSFLVTWVAREETGNVGPAHRPSLAEAAGVFEPRFIFVSTEFHDPRSRRGWRVSGSSLARYTAFLVRRDSRQPPAR